MVRDSAKHGPRLDEQMRREADPGRRAKGSATEETDVPRRTGQPPGREQGTPAGTTPREVAWRSQLAQVLSPMGFPATRGRILAYLNEAGAPANVQLALIGLPKDREFANVGEVVRALGVHTESQAADSGPRRGE